MEKWYMRDCNWAVLQLKGKCGYCDNQAEVQLCMKKLFGLLQKDRMLCHKCFTEFLQGKKAI